MSARGASERERKVRGGGRAKGTANENRGEERGELGEVRWLSRGSAEYFYFLFFSVADKLRGRKGEGRGAGGEV